MDFWNRQKVKDLETRLNIAESKNRDLREQITKLEAKLRGDRVCDGYCGNCKHGIATPNDDIFAGVICYTYECALDCKCKDFDRKE